MASSDEATRPVIPGEADIGPSFVARRLPGVVTVQVDEDAIIYDSDRNLAHLLSPTGALIWNLLDGRTPLDELSADLAEAFGVTQEQVIVDVLTLVRELERQGLLEEGSSLS